MKLLVALLFASTLLVLSLRPAEAWTDTRYFTDVQVLGHNFHKVTARNSDCWLFVTVFFTSPNYSYHRFQAKVTMRGGAWSRTPVFYSQGNGERTYTYSHDTGPQGCWAARPQRVEYLRVTGCRGHDCQVPPNP